MANKKYTKESDLKRLLEILNKSEDHKSLFNILKTQKKQIETGDFTAENPIYLGKDENELESYMRALDEIVTNYKYDPELKKYVKKPKGGIGRLPSIKPIPKGGMAAPLNKNKGGMIDYRSKGLFR